ncbi:Dyp-type peroxidase [Pseudoalteromonas sp. CnMc7-15]|uniref:Dyp-type peroxidase n=1 Tax=unclassified Pseudoalteromonas TaxID=194690 RepID=UPI001EF64F48|nr:Dyp-type peroxidase [Pseudoalteromonas sp. CnMc7-15]MCG7566425.1 Dyp-type peroxidase [Pseudoalteromonas sp. CnMc7-15]
MPRAQSGVCAQANLHGLHLFLNVLDGHDHAVKSKLAQLVDLQSEYDDRFSEAMVSSFVAIGAQYWPHFHPDAMPAELASFPSIPNRDHHVLAQPFDLFIQIRSDREDVNHLFGQRVLKLLGSDVELVEEITCYRFLDGRDFNGFLYAPDTPHGRQKNLTALINDPGNDFVKGSYVHVQRFTHNLNAWQTLSTEEQELVIGRTRLDAELLMPINANSHAARSELKDEKGEPLLLHQGMPFGTMTKQGLLSVTCAASGDAFTQMLKSQLGDHHHYDAWLDFTQADMGSAFFAPSVDFLKSLATRSQTAYAPAPE